MESPTRTRALLAGLAITLVPLGLVSRSFAGPAWLRNGLGATLYEVFWIAALQCLLVRTAPSRIAAAVFATTCAFELLQLSHHPALVTLRSTTPGRLLLGGNGGFDEIDFLWYLVGSALGWLLVRSVARKQSPR